MRLSTTCCLTLSAGISLLAAAVPTREAPTPTAAVNLALPEGSGGTHGYVRASGGRVRGLCSNMAATGSISLPAGDVWATSWTGDGAPGTWAFSKHNIPVAQSPPASAPASAARNPLLWPFASTSPWNIALGDGATFEAIGQTRTADLLDTSVGSYLNAGSWSMPVVHAQPSDPLVSVHPRYVQAFSASYSGWTEAPPGYTTSFRIPTRAVPSQPGDQHLLVIDPSGRWINEMWEAVQRSDTSWTAGYHARVSLYGSGVAGGGARAYGGSALGGLVRSWELESGLIRHVLAISLKPSQMSRGHVWPAISDDGGTGESGSIRMGELLAIAPSVDLKTLGLSPDGLTFARALQQYGAYVVDRAQNVAFYAEPALEGSPHLTRLRADLGKIRPQLRVVTNNSATTVGGPGNRMAPVAPALTSQ